MLQLVIFYKIAPHYYFTKNSLLLHCILNKILTPYCRLQNFAWPEPRQFLQPLLRIEDRTILYYIFPPLGCQLHEGKDFRLLSSLLNAQSLEQCLAHSSHVSDVP